jgi:threonine dehydrogenase-like Zn-dependent dehydrogenase
MVSTPSSLYRGAFWKLTAAQDPPVRQPQSTSSADAAEAGGHPCALFLRPWLPLVLGNEFAGEVVAVGDEVKRRGARALATDICSRIRPGTIRLNSQA